ncbi:cache domain-containing protein [Pseudomonas sp. SST3]|uniref:cache domain-containing protein n=1 Tax=Pseudomonas sp. SST3 TaxID=2267882 RepID=UPI000DFA1127|nr:cache domain-containing protein [Pseudomonas sp. SST3]NKQ10151.1 histidine kinase [Pseudomonas sp. SST3]
MQLRHKIAALSILPLLLAVAVVCALVIVQNQRLGEQQAQLIEASILASKQAELKHYVEMATSIIAPLYDSGLDDEETKQKVLAALSRFSFGSDGYFFVYDQNGRNLMHPRQPELVGQNLWDMTDPNGLPVIQALMQSARSGQGFQRYTWQKPSSGQFAAKLAYVVMLDRWGWMLGTGLYLEDVDQAILKVHEEVSGGIHTTMLAITGVALVAVLLVFASGLTLNVSERRLADRKLQALTQRIVSLQEEERSRVSRELHDGISQLLVSIKFQFELASHQLVSGNPKALETLDLGTERLAGAIGEVRRISHDLHPSLLDTLGLSAAVGQLVAEFEQRSGLKMLYSNDLSGGDPEDSVAVALFRVLQEALTNIERHAAARSVRISLEGDDASVRLRVRDDGVGFNPRQLDNIGGGGIGLRNIRERVEHFGGRFSLLSAAGGTELDVTLPARAG